MNVVSSPLPDLPPMHVSSSIKHVSRPNLTDSRVRMPHRWSTSPDTLHERSKSILRGVVSVHLVLPPSWQDFRRRENQCYIKPTRLEHTVSGRHRLLGGGMLKVFENFWRKIGRRDWKKRKP